MNIKVFSSEFKIKTKVNDVEEAQNIIIKSKNKQLMFDIGQNSTKIYLVYREFDEDNMEIKRNVFEIGNKYEYNTIQKFIKDIIIMIYDNYSVVLEKEAIIYLI